MDTNQHDNTPYQILGVTAHSSMNLIKKRYKELALRFHPDKCGGNSDKFRLIQLSYVKILEEFKLKQIDKAFHELKMDFEEFSNKQERKQPSQQNEDLFQNQKSSNYDNLTFHEAFNKEFEVNKKQTPFDSGYGNSMMKSTKKREDFTIENEIGKYNESKFNHHFDNNGNTNSQKHMKKLMKYTVPEPTQLNKSLMYTELGVDKISDFSGENQDKRSLHYMDYMTAHNTSKLIDKSSVKKRTQYNSIEDVEKERTNVPVDMNREEKETYEKYTRKQKMREDYLQAKLKEQDNEWTSHHERVSLLMSSYRK